MTMKGNSKTYKTIEVEKTISNLSRWLHNVWCQGVTSHTTFSMNLDTKFDLFIYFSASIHLKVSKIVSE